MRVVCKLLPGNKRRSWFSISSMWRRAIVRWIYTLCVQSAGLGQLHACHSLKELGPRSWKPPETEETKARKAAEKAEKAKRKKDKKAKPEDEVKSENAESDSPKCLGYAWHAWKRGNFCMVGFAWCKEEKTEEMNVEHQAHSRLTFHASFMCIHGYG